MKLSCFALLSSAIVALAARDYTSNFDYLTLGRLQQNPLRELEYSGDFQVGRYSVQASNIEATSKKLLFSGPGPVDARLGSIKIARSGFMFDVKSLRVGCSGKKTDGKKDTVSCEIEMTGRRVISGSEVFKKVSFKGDQMQTVSLEDDFFNLQTMSFRLRSAGNNDELRDGVTLLMDDIQYSIAKEY